jgi:hypothetical protein
MRGNLFWIGYVLGVAMLLLGGGVLAGYLTLRTFDGEGADLFRTVFGGVLVLYGIYRIVLTDMQRRRREREANGHHLP